VIETQTKIENEGSENCSPRFVIPELFVFGVDKKVSANSRLGKKNVRILVYRTNEDGEISAAENAACASAFEIARRLFYNFAASLP